MRTGSDLIPVLTVTGSDGTGGSGIQADIKTCGLHGTYALSVLTAVTVQDTRGIQSTHAIAPDVIDAQLSGIIHDMHPAVAKIGMLCDVGAVDAVRVHLKDVVHVVLDAAFVSSRGERIASDEVIDAVCRLIAPQCELVIMKLRDAELLLSERLQGQQNIVSAAQRLTEMMHSGAVIIQGAVAGGNTCHDLLMMDDGRHTIYSLPDFRQRNTHGLAGTLSASIASNLALGRNLPEAVESAYRFVQTLTVYSVSSGYGHTASLLGPDMVSNHAKPGITPRQQELYNRFMQLVGNNMRQHHDVLYYANALNVTTRYLSQIVLSVTGKNTKQVLDETLIKEAESLLNTTTMSVQEVSNMLGFPSQGQLAKLFRRIAKVSPTDYRKQI